MEYKLIPKANEALTEELLGAVKQASTGNVLKIGVNEATKALNSGKAALIIIAADCDPIEYVLHLPMICEDKSVTYVYVPSMQALGRACGIARSVLACAIISDPRGGLNNTIEAIKTKVEALME